MQTRWSVLFNLLESSFNRYQGRPLSAGFWWWWRKMEDHHNAAGFLGTRCSGTRFMKPQDFQRFPSGCRSLFWHLLPPELVHLGSKGRNNSQFRFFGLGLLGPWRSRFCHFWALQLNLNFLRHPKCRKFSDQKCQRWPSPLGRCPSRPSLPFWSCGRGSEFCDTAPFFLRCCRASSSLSSLSNLCQYPWLRMSKIVVGVSWPPCCETCLVESVLVSVSQQTEVWGFCPVGILRGLYRTQLRSTCSKAT